MNNYIKSTDYLIEKALGPITEFLLWTLSVLGMIVFFPKFTLIWIVLGVFATGGFYQSFFSSKKRFLTKIRIKSTQ